jgi:UDP-N-acetylglucosamine diphosphorylase/glucosamine-1-phosphate N-acetyltransferase
MLPLVIFDDGRGRFGPMTDLRASFEMRTGMFTTAARIASIWKGALSACWVPPRLQALVSERARVPVNELPAGNALRLVNGRWLLPEPQPGLTVGEAIVESNGGAVMAATLDRRCAEAFMATFELPDGVRSVVSRSDGRALAELPWHVLERLPQTLSWDLQQERLVDAKPIPSSMMMGEHAVQVHRTAVVGLNVVFDAQLGPIRVDERAVIRPGSILCGPCSIGAGSTVMDHALIKPNTAIGPVCKVAGEIGGTIFQGYANKAHDGHLGDSWVGKWVNFGAGTTNSNLLNTYGEVTIRVEPDGPRLRTGMTYLGAIVGDHAKFAINTRLMTGTVVGTGAMIATTAPPPTTVRRFAWLTDEGERTYGLEKFLEVMDVVMKRRDDPPTPAYRDAVRTLHEASVRP